METRAKTSDVCLSGKGSAGLSCLGWSLVVVTASGGCQEQAEERISGSFQPAVDSGLLHSVEDSAGWGCAFLA